MKNIETVEIDLYTYWANVLINGDWSGIDINEEEPDIDEFLSRMRAKYPRGFDCVNVSEEHWFGRPDPHWCPNALPGDVTTYVFHININQ